MTEAKFHISFTNDFAEDESCEGAILLNGLPDTFISSLSFFSKQSYENQWAKAIRMASCDREITALFSNVDLDVDGTGWLWFYTLIPSEDVISEGHQEKGIFITHSFKPVCTDPKSFLTRRFIEFEDGSLGEELSFYFLDLKYPERFFGYLDPQICEISHWFVSDKDIKGTAG